MLPFGLRSAPKFFSAIADTLQWILIQQGIKHILHYLGVLILIVSSLDQAHSDKTTPIATFHQISVPLTTFPGYWSRYRGLDIPSTTQQVAEVAVRIISLHPLSFHHKKRIQSLTGLLQFASKIVHPGRPFLRQLYAMQNIGSHSEHHVHLKLLCQSRHTMVAFIHSWLEWYIHVEYWVASSRIQREGDMENLFWVYCVYI